MFDLKKFFLDLFFPISCLGCQEPGQWLCPKCLGKIKINFSQNCHQVDNNFLDGVWVAADYKQALVQELLKNFKYNFIVDVNDILAGILVKFLDFKIRQGEISEFDLFIPVPLSRKRKNWRGFNQSGILAEKISKNFSWEFNSDLLYRKYHTCPQVGLKAEERKNNLRGIFRVKDGHLLKNKKVLLIDDVLTTGTTLLECAKTLKMSGAKEVWGLVIAKG